MASRQTTGWTGTPAAKKAVSFPICRLTVLQMSHTFYVRRLEEVSMPKKRKPSRPKRQKQRSLTDVEWAIMNVVWDREPCAAGTVREALEATHGWAYSTVKTTMDRMVAKGLLATHAIRNLNLFTALISRDDAKRGELRRLLHRAFDGALTPMIQFVVEEEELSEEELGALRSIVNRAKRRKP
jgi:predicted transcriptional regulator